MATPLVFFPVAPVFHDIIETNTSFAEFRYRAIIFPPVFCTAPGSAKNPLPILEPW
jgi:hypothetical protein